MPEPVGKGGRRPDFFIIGAPKCGTSSLASCLAAHPKIFMSDPKEPCFFCSDITIGGRFRELHAYERLFAGAGPEHLAVGEGSTNYLYSKLAIRKILAYSPGAKFIVMLRNPLEMAPSLHSEVVFHLADDLEDFERAWYAQERRRRGFDIPPTCSDPQLLLYGERCLLGAQLERLYAQVSRDRVLVIFLEEFTEAPAETYRRVLDFLGVPTDGRRTFPVANARRTTRSMGFRRTLDQVGRLKRALLGDRPSGILAPLHRMNTAPVQPAGPGHRLKAEMKVYFAQDVRKLEALVDRDLGHWC